MSEQIEICECGFFNSVDGDRPYNAEQMCSPYNRVISNGVFATPAGTPSTDLQVISTTGKKIVVSAGAGLFADKWFKNNTNLEFTIDDNVTAYPRIDSIIVRIDKRNIGRTGAIVLVSGQPATSPSAPTLNLDTEVVEYRVANIAVASNFTEITQAQITDLRGSAECPWVTSIIQQVDTSTLYDQWRSAYDQYYESETERFNAFMEMLTEQLAVNFSVVELHHHTTTSADNTTTVAIGIGSYDTNKDLLHVNVNGFDLIEHVDYTISNDTILLARPLKAGQLVEFTCLKTVIVGDAETALQAIEAVNARVDDIVLDVIRDGETSDKTTWSSEYIVEYVEEHGGGGGCASSWSDLEDKPFTFLNNEDFTVTDGGELHVVKHGCPSCQWANEAQQTFLSFDLRPVLLFTRYEEYLDGTAKLLLLGGVEIDRTRPIVTLDDDWHALADAGGKIRKLSHDELLSYKAKLSGYIDDIDEDTIYFKSEKSYKGGYYRFNIWDKFSCEWHTDVTSAYYTSSFFVKTDYWNQWALYVTDNT